MIIHYKMLKIYDEYKKYGVENYYKLHNKQYFNPHLNKIEILYQKYLIELVDINTSIIDIPYSASTMEPALDAKS
jgi:hypothetical protein